MPNPHKAHNKQQQQTRRQNNITQLKKAQEKEQEAPENPRKNQHITKSKIQIGHTCIQDQHAQKPTNRTKTTTHTYTRTATTHTPPKFKLFEPLVWKAF